MSVLHPEALGNGADLAKAQALVQMARVDIRGDDGVELQHAEAVRLRLCQTVGNELFADVQPARRA